MNPEILYTNQYYLYGNHLKRLSTSDRLARFDHVITDEQIDRYVAQIDPDDLVLATFSSNQIIGAAHISPIVTDLSDRTIELGISIESEFQQLGLGTELMKEALEISAVHRYMFMLILCQSDNLAMVTLAKKFGASFINQQGETYAYISLQDQKCDLDWDLPFKPRVPSQVF